MDYIESTDEGLRELALFAGAGGGILGGHLLGWQTICAVEWDGYARDVLVARQNDGCLEAFPIWDDVQTFDGRPWRGRVDVVSGGFPCQDISCAGKGAGIEGERSSMWKHMARIIGEVRPRFVFVENSPMLVGRGLAVVIADLTEMGYDAKWGIVGAHHAGAPHKRDRIWIVADSKEERCGWSGIPKIERESLFHFARGSGGDQAPATRDGGKAAGKMADSMRSRPQGSEWEREASEARQSTGHALQCCSGADVADTESTGLERHRSQPGESEISESRDDGASVGNSMRGGLPQPESKPMQERSEDRAIERSRPAGASWWATEPELGRVAHGVAARVDRLRCIGNGQVPAVAKLAWEILRE
jgi:DNA (cytosine-5)-methyltransferase 1